MDEAFVKRIIALRGDAGKKWLDSLPRLINLYEKKWKFKVGKPFSLSYNYVTSVITHNSDAAILKIGFPRDKEFLSEIAALKEFDGNGAVKLIQVDTDNAVILEEQVIPGTSLSTLSDDEKATRIAADIVQKLWMDVPESQRFIHLEDWLEGFERYEKHFGSKGQLPKELFLKGRELFEHLLDTTQEKKLLHGDFHHGNILFSEKDGWVVIDPKGVIGDPVYDLSVFLYNPIPGLMQRANVEQVVKRRIEIFSDTLGFDKRRIKEWGIAQAVLSAIWSIEDKRDPQYAIQFAHLLNGISL